MVINADLQFIQILPEIYITWYQIQIFVALNSVEISI